MIALLSRRLWLWIAATLALPLLRKLVGAVAERHPESRVLAAASRAVGRSRRQDSQVQQR